ncbi:hydrogenase iron-sulfur subunit [Thermodesulfobacteriota bacterium]
MDKKQELTLAVFYCKNVPESSEKNRQDLEIKYSGKVRLFPLPCSGRLEPVHLLRALEEFADAAFLITCPEGACRYFEGNRRAKKRVEATRSIISGIGMEPERVGIIVGSKDDPKPLDKIVEQIIVASSPLGVSPVFQGSSVHSAVSNR